MLQFGLRLGRHPRQVITTTPRPSAIIKRILADQRSAVTRAATSANSANLPAEFMEAILARYAGTRLGRQELDGEMIEDRADALWTRAMIEATRVATAPPLRRVVVAVALYHRLEADAIVAEVNQGGDMVAAVIAEADPDTPVRKVRATRGKYLRAAPVAQLYEQGRVKHVGVFTALEDEMCDFGPTGLSNGRSPDRLDALVWALTDLALGPKQREPRVRRV